MTWKAASPLVIRRRRVDWLFQKLCWVMMMTAAVVLVLLLFHVFREGVHRLNWGFFVNFSSRFPEKAGILSAILGTLWIVSVATLFSVPIGVASAVYLEEYGGKGRLAHWVELNIANLAGVPSIIYGLLGLTIFNRLFGLGTSILSGSLALSLLVLPVIVIASREALRAVPDSIRHAAFALGATRWKVVFGQVLPAAIPGIMTGIILSVSRAIGETAPLIVVGAVSYAAFVPKSAWDEYTVLPIQIFNWASRPEQEFHELAAAAIIVLLGVLMVMNFTAIVIRNRSSRGRGI